jgi:hypothetical protein
MSRPLKLALWLVSILLVLMISAVIVIKVVFTRERILAMLTPRLEEAISRKIAIADAGISFWGGLGVWLGDVTIENKPGYSLEPLFTIHKVEFKARLLPLLIGRVRLDRVLLESPSLLLEFDGEGHSNVSDLVRRRRPPAGGAPSATGEDEVASSLPIGNVVLRDGELIIDNYKTQRRIDVHGVRLAVTADNAERPWTVIFDADLSVDSFTVSDTVRDWSVPEGIPHAYGAGRLDISEKSVTFDSLMLNALGAVVSIQGAVRSNPGLTEIRFNANLAPIEIRSVTRQLEHAGFLRRSPDIEGKIVGDIQANMTWPLPAGTVPDWLARFDLTGVRYQSRGWTGAISIPRIEIRGEAQTVSWGVSSGKIPGGTFSISGAIDKVFSPNPDVSAHFVADCDSAATNSLIPVAGGILVGGDLHLDVNAFGPLRSWHSVRFGGRCQSEKLVLVNEAWAVDTVVGVLDWELSGHDLNMLRTDWRAGSSVGHVVGTVAELTPSVLAGFKTLDVPRARLDVSCPFLNLDELIGETTDPPPDTGRGASGASLPVVSADGRLACDTLIYSRMTLTEVRSPFTVRDNVLSFEPGTARVCGGRVAGSFRWDIGDWSAPTFAADIRADSLQADSLLSRYFGWAGALTGDLDLTGQFSGRGRHQSQILPTLIAAGRASMHSGRLEATPLLASVGEKLGVSGLDRPHPFRDFLVSFKVASGRIVTDSLRFVTDDARWTAIGSYGFDQTLDYVVGLTLTPGRTSGLAGLTRGTQLRFGLAGTASNPQIDLDVKNLGRSLIGNLLVPKSDTTAGSTTVDDFLKSLFRKKKP